MSLIVRGGGDFVPAPEGLHTAVCVDVIDLGMAETQWGDKHMIALVWEIGFLMDDGRPYTVRKRYTASLHQKSNLHKDLKSWRGQAFTAEELAGFDIEKVLGAPCQVLVQHAEREGVVYANVTTVMKIGPGQKIKPSGTYVRAKDRTEQAPPAGGSNGRSASRQPGEDDSAPVEEPVPF